MNYYDILGIDESATQEEIKKAYRTLVKRYHPDVNKAENASTFFNLIKEAYDILGNEKSRKDYDSMNNNSKINNDYYNNKNYSNEKDESMFNSQTRYYEEFNGPINKQRNIFMEICIMLLKVLLKLILIILIPIISFIKSVSMLIGGIIIFISRIFMGLSLLMVFKEIYEIVSRGSSWKEAIIFTILAFVAYCFPYIVMIIPVGLELLRDKIQDFILSS